MTSTRTSLGPRTASASLVRRLERETKRNWDVFYKQNQTRFYKDRHWQDHEFGALDLPSTSPERAVADDTGVRAGEDSGVGENADPGEALGRSEDDFSEERPVLLELGCGVGNALYPLLAAHQRLRAYACDFSPRAVEFVRAHEAYDPARVHAFVHDLTSDASPTLAEKVRVGPGPGPGWGAPTVINMIFVLSAIAPAEQAQVLQRVVACFDRARGGMLRFRDYATGDLAQERYDAKDAASPGYYEPARLDSSLPWYRRGTDGTLAYFFEPTYLARLARDAGLEGPEPIVQERIVVNRKQQSTMHRRFIQAAWIFPPQPSAAPSLIPATPPQHRPQPLPHTCNPATASTSTSESASTLASI